MENPFFQREVRALCRSAFPAVRTWTVWLGVLAGAPLLFAELCLPSVLDLPGRRALTLLILLAGQAIVLAAVGWALGNTVLQRDLERGTLDSLRLLPDPPSRWLRRKLLLPFYGLGVATLALLPFNLALAVRGHFLPSELLRGTLLALVVGLAALGGALLRPAFGRDADARGGTSPGTRTGSGEALLWFSLGDLYAILLLFVAGTWIREVSQTGMPGLRSVGFFGARLPLAGLLALADGVLLLAGLAVTWIAAQPASPHVGSISLRIRRSVLVAAFGAVAGVFWQTSSPVARGVLLAVLAAAVSAIGVTAESLRPGRGEDSPQSWPDRWTANPVFLRDLRAHFRTRSFARYISGYALGLLAATAVLAGLAAVSPVWRALVAALVAGTGPGAVRHGGLAAPAALVGYVWTCMAPMSAVGPLARFWQAELRCNTLPQLLTVPIPTRSIVLGRLGAALVPAAGGCLPGLGLWVTGLALGARAATPSMLLAGLGLAWFASLMLPVAACASSAVTLQRRPDGKPRVASRGQALLGALFLVEAVLFIAVMNRVVPPEYASAVMAGILPLNVAFAALALRWSTEELEILRTEADG